MIHKVTKVDTDEELDRLMECAEIHRSLHDHPNIAKVIGIQWDQEQNLFILLLERGLGSMRDIIHPDTDDKREMRERFLAKMSPKVAKGLFFCFLLSPSVSVCLSVHSLASRQRYALFAKTQKVLCVWPF